MHTTGTTLIFHIDVVLGFGIFLFSAVISGDSSSITKVGLFHVKFKFNDLCKTPKLVGRDYLKIGG
jgi:hypothetical protein